VLATLLIDRSHWQIRNRSGSLAVPSILCVRLPCVAGAALRVLARRRRRPARPAAADWSPPPGTRRARKQRPDLQLVRGVVQHHQHPPPGQHAAIQPSLAIQVCRDVLGILRVPNSR
jgi:hypothetical protein